MWGFALRPQATDIFFGLNPQSHCLASELGSQKSHTFLLTQVLSLLLTTVEYKIDHIISE